MASPFKRPSGTDIVVLATLDFSGIATAYLPTQMSQDTGWQAELGPWITAAGLAVMAGATLWFIFWHIRYPQALTTTRLRFYRKPYWPDTVVDDFRGNPAGDLVTIARSIELKPYGWSADDPFVELTFWIFNGSIHTVRLGGPVRGDVYVGKVKLLDAPKLTESGGGWLHRHKGRLKMEQRMKRPQWEALNAAAEDQSTLDLLITGNVSVQVIVDFEGSHPTRFSLGTDAPLTVTREQ